MDKKNSFVMYMDSWDVIEELDPEQRGILLAAIYAIQLGTELPEMDKETRIVFKTIKAQLFRDKTKYEETIEARKKAGQKGGLKSAEVRRSKTIENSTKTKQSQANEAVSDSDSVSDSVSDSDIGASDGQTDDILTLGVKDNVHLCRSELAQIRATYQQTNKLIDKVSLWLDKAKRPPKDHAALLHKFAVNDDWPRKPRPEPEPEPRPDPSRGEFCSAPDEVKAKAAALGIKVN